MFILFSSPSPRSTFVSQDGTAAACEACRPTCRSPLIPGSVYELRRPHAGISSSRCYWLENDGVTENMTLR